VDLFTVVLNVFKTRHNGALMSLLKVLGHKRFILSLEKWLFPLTHHLLHFLDIILHLLHKIIYFLHNRHALLDEGIDSL